MPEICDHGLTSCLACGTTPGQINDELARTRAELDMLRNQIKGYEAGRQVENERLGEAVYYCGLSVFYAVLGLKWVLKARRWWRE